jgi:hypothetical protein
LNKLCLPRLLAWNYFSVGMELFFATSRAILDMARSNGKRKGDPVFSRIGKDVVDVDGTMMSLFSV